MISTIAQCPTLSHPEQMSKPPGRKPRLPLREMKPGQSIFVPTPTPQERTRTANTVFQFSSRYPKHRFTTRFVTENEADGLRIWRIKTR